MAVVDLGRTSGAFERVSALRGIARNLLAIRIVSCLLVTVWLAMRPGLGLATVCVAVLSAWLLLLLLRWDHFGIWVTTHPAVLALDVLGCLALLTQAPPMSPALLVLGTGCLLVGVCLGYRGCAWFSLIVIGGWWFAYAGQTTHEQFEGRDDAFVVLALVPAMLMGAMYAGAGIRSATLQAVEVENELRAQVRLAGVAEERARLAREMHDSLTKSLHGISMMADALPRWIDIDQRRAATEATQIGSLLKQTTHESRELILAMRRAPAGATLADIVTAVTQRWERTSDRDVAVHLQGDPRLPTESSYELSAILNEALENVSRHTPAGTSVEVRLEQDQSWVRLSVSDDGGGLAPGGSFQPAGHFGVIGMKERAARVGGSAEVRDDPGQGVSVVVRMPALDPDTAEE